MKQTLKPSRTLWGSWAWKPFCVPHFLFVGNRLQPLGPSLSSQGEVQALANQGREGMQRRGRGSQETIEQPGGRVLILLQEAHRTMSLSSSAELKPQQVEDVNYVMKRSSFWRKGHSLVTRRTTELIRRTPEARLKDCRTCRHRILVQTLPLNHCYETPHQIPPPLLSWDTLWKPLARYVLLCLANR